MASFQITLSPNRRAAARFIARVHRTVHETFAQKQADGLRQSDIARALGVHRSVINRELRGAKDMTLGRVAELAWAMGKEAIIRFEEPKVAAQTNIAPPRFTITAVQNTSATASFRPTSIEARQAA